MLLSARLLNAVSSVNHFEIADAALFSEGDALTLYFQLVDASLDSAAKGFSPSGRRYVPEAGATLSVTLTNIDDAKQIVRSATLAFPADDRSIWKISILSSDGISGTSDMILRLTEGSKVTTGRVQAALRVSNATGACC